jgi:glycosyltransferase involved in cell wall biosynthesis
MKLSVLLTCEDYLPSVGGAEICVANVARELRARGHEAVIFTNTTKTTGDEAGIVRVPWKFDPVTAWKNVSALRRLIRAADVVHCTYSFRIAAICAVLCKLAGKPMLLTQQGKGIVPEANPKWRNAVLVRLCQEVSMRGATHITATSDEILELTAAFVPRSKIEIVSNGYDAHTFSPDSSLPMPPEWSRVPAGVKTLLTVRRLVPKNGIHILVQALALVRADGGDFHYFAIGEGRARPLIERLIAENGLERHVTLLGMRSNDTVKPYYQHADLVLMPSSAEARSITCIEAMGMEKPLIASQVGGLIDLIGRDDRHGQLVDIYRDEACSYDPPERLPAEQLRPLADAILAFLRDPSDLRAKAAVARAYVERECSWEAITSQYESLYDRLLGRA